MGKCNMSEYKNIFKEKNDEELRKLYGQFLEWENTGVIIGKELGEICDIYCKWFNSNPLGMIQHDLLHTMADLWYGINKES